MANTNEKFDENYFENNNIMSNVGTKNVERGYSRFLINLLLCQQLKRKSRLYHSDNYL